MKLGYSKPSISKYGVIMTIMLLVGIKLRRGEWKKFWAQNFWL